MYSREKNMNSLLDFSIKALFLTNVWIIIYTKLVDYLNYRFPASLSETFFRNGLGNPEPFEIPLYIFLSLLFVIMIWFFYNFKPALKIPALDKTFLSVIKILVFLLLLILFLSKRGSFPLGGDTSIHPSQISIPDLSFFYGPIYEVASGKTIFTDIPSQYGFLSIIFFAILYKVTQFNFAYLPIFISITYIIEYFFCFYLIKQISKSTFFSLLGLFSTIVINYFASTYGPQASPLRWLPIFLTLYLLYKFKKAHNKILLFLIPILSLWNIDSGIALIIGYSFTLFILFISGRINFKKLLSTYFFLALFSILLVGVIEGFHLLFGFQPVDFFKLYHSIRKYALVGTGMVPIEPHTYFWFVMLVYFASIIYFFRNTKNVSYGQDNTLSLQLLLFSANLMLFASIYYVGRSMSHELYTISTFAILTFFLLIGSTYQNIPIKLRALTFALIFLFLIIFPVFKRFEFIKEKVIIKISNLAEGKIFPPGIDQTIKEKYRKEVELISNNIKEKEILIISADDTYLFYLINKKNLLDANPTWGTIQIKSEVEPAIKRAVNTCPKKIVVDCSLLNKCPSYKTLTQGDLNAFPFLLQQLEKDCNVRYSPSICTDKLCIAETMQ